MEIFLVLSIWYLIGLVTLLVSMMLIYTVRKVFGLKLVIRSLESKGNKTKFILIGAAFGPFALAFVFLAVLVFWVFALTE